MRTLGLLAVIFLLPVAMGASDRAYALDLKPGVWESTSVSDLQGMEIPEQALAHMTAEQRVKVEAAIKANAASGPTIRTHKTCETQVAMDKFFNAVDTKANCKRTGIHSSGDQQDFHEECNDGRQKTSSDVHFKAVDSTHVKGVVQSVITRMGARQPMTMHLTIDAKWMASDCSDLKVK